jgi:hypothetical protein
VSVAAIDAGIDVYAYGRRKGVWKLTRRDYQLTGDESAKKVMLDASESMVDRFSDKAGCIRSWDGDELGFMGRGYSRSNMNMHYFVIIDNMVSPQI